MTHICVGNLTIIGSDNGLSPGRRQAIILTSAGLLLIGPLGTNFSEILIGIQKFSIKKMHLKMSSAKWRPFCPSLNVLTVLISFEVRFLDSDPCQISRIISVPLNNHVKRSEMRLKWLKSPYHRDVINHDECFTIHSVFCPLSQDQYYRSVFIVIISNLTAVKYVSNVKSVISKHMLRFKFMKICWIDEC